MECSFVCERGLYQLVSLEGLVLRDDVKRIRIIRGLVIFIDFLVDFVN